MINRSPSNYAWKQPKVFVPFIISIIAGIGFIASMNASSICAEPIDKQPKNLDPTVCHNLWLMYPYMGLSIINIVVCQHQFGKAKKEFETKRHP